MIQQAHNVSLAAQRGQGFAAAVADASGQPVTTCYQCQRCTSWCPVTEFMDLKPHQLVRLIQLGLTDRVYESRSIWLCVGCAGCGATCPNDIDFHHVADTLQQAADDEARGRAGALTAFDKAFLATVRKKGRASEIGLVMRFKLATGRFMADMKLGMWMMLRGKLRLFGESVRQKRQIREMFDRADKRKKEARR